MNDLNEKFTALTEGYEAPEAYGLDPEVYLGVVPADLGYCGLLNQNERIYAPRPWCRANLALNARAQERFDASSASEKNHPWWGPTFNVAARILRVELVTADGRSVKAEDVEGLDVGQVVKARGLLAFLKTTEGRDLWTLRKAGWPLGTSSRTMGEAIEAVLDETSPYLAANAVHKGKLFSHVYDVDENYFTYDIVTEPSAGTYVDASESVVKAVESLIEAKVLSERTRQVLRETTVAVEKVAEPVVVETPAQEDEKMDEITVESLKAAHPEVVEAIKAEVKPAITEEEVAKLREQAAKATELAETLMREKTEREMAQSMKAALVSALEETVEGVDQIHKALRPYVEQLVVVERFEKPEDVVSEVKRVAAVVKAVNDESKAGSAVPAKALDDDAKVESKEQKIVSRTREAMTALLGENYRNVFKQNRG